MVNAIKNLLKKLIGEVEPATIARTLCFFLAIINQILVATDHSIIPIENETIEAVVTNGFTIIASIVAWWKNNSFTKPAIKADAYMKELKGN